MTTGHAPGSPGATRPSTGAYQTTPNAEKYVLQADALRRRQLVTALVHGSHRTWRERQRVWPASIAGVVAVVLIMMVIAAMGAFDRQRELNEAKEREQGGGSVSFPVQKYQGMGISVHVPADWQQEKDGDAVVFTDPEKERWLSLRVRDDDRDEHRILEERRSRLERGCCGLKNYEWLGMDRVVLGSYEGAELRWAGTDDGSVRHFLMRVVTVDGRSYEVNLSVPENGLPQSQPILDEVARSFELTR